MRALLLVLLLVAFPASAGELVAKRGDDEVRLFDSPCIHGGTLGQIPPAMREQFHKATGRFNGQMFYGCWIPRGDMAVVLWEDGDQGLIPLAELKPTTNI